MSDNNIYNILGKLDALKPQAETTKQTAERIYESVEAQGSVMAGVNSVEARLNEKYMGFKKTVAAVAKGGADNPEAVAASIGRKKYGKAAFQKAAAAGKKMGEGDMEEGIAEEREKLHTKKGTIYKGGTYGTEYDPSDEEKKTKAKHVPKKGQKGRPKKDRPAASTAPKGDIFGRTTGEVPKGKKGTKIKGKGNIDTTDESKGLALHKRYAHALGTTLAQKHGYTPADKLSDRDLPNMTTDHPEAPHGQNLLKNRIKRSLGKHPAPALPESRKTAGTMVLESVNFKRMMDEANMTLDEMLECMNQDIKAYKATGDMTDRLRDFMHLHSHAKKQMEEAGPVPYEVPAVQRRAAGTPPLTPQAVQQQDAERSMHPGMTKLDAPKPAESIDHELNELAKLAGITDEGNAFTGKLANTPKGGEFELDGKTFKDTSDLDEGGYDPEQPNGGGAGAGDITKESTCNECGMYESKCSCQEGNLFTKHLKDTPKGGEFEIDGKKYKDTSNLDEGTCPECDCDPCECGPSTTLEDIAKLAGIAVEGKDYGDTTFAEPPTYDNTPDEEVQGEDVLLKGGDGEVAGGEKAMKPNKPTWKNADNPLAENEFNPVEAMGRRLMRQYEAIKVQK